MKFHAYNADGSVLAELEIDAIVPATGDRFVPGSYLVLLSDNSQVAVSEEWLCRYYGDTWRDLARPPLTDLQQATVRTMRTWGYFNQARLAANAWMRYQQIDPPAFAQPKRTYRQFLADFAECNRQALSAGTNKETNRV